MFFEYVLVFLGAAIPWLEIGLVIPLGIIRGLSPFWVMLLAFAGNMLTILPLIIGFDKMKAWFADRRLRKAKAPSKRSKRGTKIWQKYGLPGLAMLGPILTGTHIAAFIGMALGATKRQVSQWMIISISLWTLVFGLATVFGIDLFI